MKIIRKSVGLKVKGNNNLVEDICPTCGEKVILVENKALRKGQRCSCCGEDLEEVYSVGRCCRCGKWGFTEGRDQGAWRLCQDCAWDYDQVFNEDDD